MKEVIQIGQVEIDKPVLAPRVDIIRIPDLALMDEEGYSWTTDTRFTPMGGLAIIAGTLQDAGCSVEIINMANADEARKYGELDWEGKKLDTILHGNFSHPLANLIRQSKENLIDAVAIPVNFRSAQNIAFWLISELKREAPDLKIIVGGSDVFADPEPYLQAGADAVVLNKRGGTNKAVLEAVFDGKLPNGNLFGLERAIKVIPGTGRPDFIVYRGSERVWYKMLQTLKPSKYIQVEPKLPIHSPTQPYLDEYQPIPSDDILETSLGTVYWECSKAVLAEIVNEARISEDNVLNAQIIKSFREGNEIKIGSLRLDDGCDHSCNFCQTSTYGDAYLEQSVGHSLAWAEAYKRVGADGFVIISDQYLGRVLRLGGRQRAIDIANGIKDRGLAILWGNGLEINKMTKARGIGVKDIGINFIQSLIAGEITSEWIKGNRLLTEQDIQMIGEYREESMDFEKTAQILTQFRETMGPQEINRLEWMVANAEREAPREAAREADRARANEKDPSKREEAYQRVYKRVMDDYKNGGVGTTLYKRAVLALLAGGERIEIGNNEIDGELVNALYGPKTQGYIPGERPVLGGTKESGLPKLLPPEDHMRALEAIAATDIKALTYGVILGFEDDSQQYIEANIAYLKELKRRLKRINPDLKIIFTPFTNKPIPSTENARNLEKKGLVMYHQPEIQGGFYTAAIRTNHMSVLEISEAMQRILVEVNGEDYLALGEYASTALTNMAQRERERARERWL